jgi:hypothetical protein
MLSCNLDLIKRSLKKKRIGYFIILQEIPGIMWMQEWQLKIKHNSRVKSDII